MMAPVFEQAAAQLEPQIRLAKLDTEAEPARAARSGIRSITISDRASRSPRYRSPQHI
jgi:thioredoxin-like negative regulator of GroEL